MFKPSLIIGLGGTGVLTLRHLKATLLTAQKLELLPPQVKIIGFDTVKADFREDNSFGQITALRIGLTPGEQAWIGGDIYDFVRQVDQGRHPHIDSWFQARSYLQMLPRVAFALDRGAGQLRQFGRLAIFYDVSVPMRSSIYNLLNRSISDIRKTGHFTTLDVYLVASVAGGTGSGIFVDIAHLVRKIAEWNHHLSVRLHGFLVLPEAFSAIPGGVRNAMYSRAFASMRENKRFMVNFPYEPGYPMNYQPRDAGPIWNDRIKNKLFDSLYYVDGLSKKTSLNAVPPEMGVIAGIADGIASMIDGAYVSEENIYALYSAHSVNIVTEMDSQGMTETGDENAAPMYSALGVFTLVLPMHWITQWLSYRLIRKALETLFPAVIQDEDGYVIQLAPDANSEAPGMRGRDASTRFLEVSEIQSIRDDIRVSGTPLLPREVLRVAQEFSLTDQHILMELMYRKAEDWEDILIPPEPLPELNDLRQRVFSKRLIEEVPPNLKGESAQHAKDRIFKSTEAFKLWLLGPWEILKGRRTGGQYGNALKTFSQIQMEHFRLMMRIESENILNGGLNPNDLTTIRKAGKLGFLLDWLEGIEDILGIYLKAINAAKDLRERRNEKQNVIQVIQDAKHQLATRPGGIWGGRRRKYYLEAEQRLIDLEKALIAEGVAFELVQQMLSYTQRLRESAQNWAEVMAIGFDSLHGHVLRAERRIEDAIRMENQVLVREFLWDEQYLHDLYVKYAEERRSGLDAVLADITWQLTQQWVGNSKVDDLQIVVESTEKTLAKQLNRDGRNLRLLLSLSESIFADAWEQESIAKYLRTRKYPSPHALSGHLAERTDVWLQTSATTAVPAYFLHVAHGDDPSDYEYLMAVGQELSHITGATEKLIQITNSSDRFSLRLVCSQGLIPLKEINSYKKAEESYWSSGYRESSGLLSRETLHIFPAEVNAVRFERKIADMLGIGSYELSLRSLVLLEYPERFALFVRAWAYGLVVEEMIGDNRSICLHLPEQTNDVDLGMKSLALTIPKSEKSDFIEALGTFVYLGRDIRPDIHSKIDYGNVDKLCRRKIHEVGGTEAAIALLQEFRRKSVATFRDSDDKNIRDIGELMEVIIQEEIEYLKIESRSGMKFFSLWDDFRISHFLQYTDSFCERLASECGMTIVSSELKGNNSYLVVFEVGNIFDGLARFPRQLPVIFFAGEINERSVSQIRKALSSFVGLSPQIALLITFAEDRDLIGVRSYLAKEMKEKYAYDIIVPAQHDLRTLLISQDPRRAFRKLVLSQIDLTMISPFVLKGTTPSNMFFGRERELREITEKIPHTSFVLIGGRLIGKTSILKRLHDLRLPTNGHIAYYKDCTIASSQNELLEAIVKDTNWFPNGFSGYPLSFSDIIAKLANPNDKLCVFLFDEVDKLVAFDRNKNYPMLRTWRALSNSGKYRFVLSGEKLLRTQLMNPDSPLYNFGNELLIGRLERAAVEELVTRPMRQLGIDFLDREKVLQLIWDFTSGHPNLVQRLCHRLLMLVNERKDRSIAPSDVSQIGSDINFLRKDFLNVYWQRATVLERLSSLAMAVDSNVRTLPEVHESLHKYGINLTLNEVDDALERLVDLRNILQRTNEGYEFAVTAFPEVIAKTARFSDLVALNREIYKNKGDVVPELK